MSVHEALEGALVTGTSEEGRSRIYWIQDGQKLWVLNPEAFAERGWKFEDVRVLTDARLDAIPTSEQVIGAHLQYVPRDNARKRVAEPFLDGKGIELSDGANPHPLTDREPQPDKEPSADFLVAHDLLERCADPIGTAIELASYVRDEGTVVLSVPCLDFCPDKGRLVPGIDHLLFDFLFSRGADHFESREHAYSCSAGWMNTWEEWLLLDNKEVASRMHAKAHTQDLVVHWHAFTPDLFDQLLQAASHFSPRPLHLMAWADPYQEPDEATVGDIIAVLRVGGEARPGDLAFRTADVQQALQTVGRSLEQALLKIRNR